MAVRSSCRAAPATTITTGASGKASAGSGARSRATACPSSSGASSAAGRCGRDAHSRISRRHRSGRPNRRRHRRHNRRDQRARNERADANRRPRPRPVSLVDDGFCRCAADEHADAGGTVRRRAAVPAAAGHLRGIGTRRRTDRRLHRCRERRNVSRPMSPAARRAPPSGIERRRTHCCRPKLPPLRPVRGIGFWMTVALVMGQH